MKKETFKLVKMGYDARQYAAQVMEGKEFIHHGDTVYSFKHVPDYEEFCKFMRYGTTTFGEEMVFTNNHEWELVEDEVLDIPIVKLVHMDSADSRSPWAHVMVGCEFYKHDKYYYSFVHKDDYLKYCEARDFSGECFGIQMIFASGHIWEEVTKSEIAVKPEKTTVKYGDVIYMKNIGVYHFMGDDRDGSFLGTAEEIVTDLDKIRLNLRPEALMKWAKFAHDTKRKFGKEIDWTL